MVGTKNIGTDLIHKNLSRAEIYIKKINGDLKAIINVLGQQAVNTLCQDSAKAL